MIQKSILVKGRKISLQYFRFISAQFQVHMSHTYIEIGTYPQKTDAHGTDTKQTQGQKTEPQVQDTEILALHEAAAGLQRVFGGAVWVIQQHKFGQTPGDGYQYCRDAGENRIGRHMSQKLNDFADIFAMSILKGSFR